MKKCVKCGGEVHALTGLKPLNFCRACLAKSKHKAKPGEILLDTNGLMKVGENIWATPAGLAALERTVLGDHRDDTLGYYQGNTIRGDTLHLRLSPDDLERTGPGTWTNRKPIKFDGFEGFGFTSGRHYAVVTPACRHKWGAWKRSGGRFDHRGDIETTYSRWCEKCREGEEQTLRDRF
jgi:hypothetical protein